MQSFASEYNRLKKIENWVKKIYSHLGVNKKQELIRLLYEISKREDLVPNRLLIKLPLADFHSLKRILLQRRYPNSFLSKEIRRVYLPKIKISKNSVFDLERYEFSPRKIVIEEAVADSTLSKRFQQAFPKAKQKIIPSLKEYLKKIRCHKINDYNRRKETIFIVKERFDFFKSCPCTKNALGCGYHIFNLGFGCIFECTYCFLQEYTNSPGIILPANLDGFFSAFGSYQFDGMRLGSGEFSDSLMLDEITEYSLELIDFFRGYPKVKFEFKTKSKNIENLLKARHQGNIVVGWTLSPDKVIAENEFFSAKLNQRLEAAKICSQAGYKISFHLDPVLHFPGWQKEYCRLIELIFSKVKTKDIAWVSIGTLRFNAGLKPIIEQRFPTNRILDAELIYGFDNKLRYPFNIRKELYTFLLKLFFSKAKNIPIYLCMEELRMWQEVGIKKRAL